MSRLTPLWQRTRSRLERWAERLRLDRVSNRQIVIAAGLSVVLAVVTWQQCGLSGCPNIDRLAREAAA